MPFPDESKVDVDDASGYSLTQFRQNPRPLRKTLNPFRASAVPVATPVPSKGLLNYHAPSTAPSAVMSQPGASVHGHSVPRRTGPSYSVKTVKVEPSPMQDFDSCQATASMNYGPGPAKFKAFFAAGATHDQVDVDVSEPKHVLLEHVRPKNSAVPDNYSFVSHKLRTIRKASSRTCPFSKNPVPPLPDSESGKLTLVLDVDETLIHSRLNFGVPVAKTSSRKDEDDGATKNRSRYRQDEDRKDNAAACDEFELKLQDGDVIRVNKRPGLDEFLQYVAQRYEVVAYTAGLEQYASPLLDMLDPTGTIFKYRLYRDSCLFANGYYVKDLEKLNRDLSRVVLVDNNCFCFLPQLSNGVPISSFYDDCSDDALTVLKSFLKSIENEDDVRPTLERTFNLVNVLKDQRDRILA